MLINDQVYCDCCSQGMGQIMGGSTVVPGVIADFSQPPYFAVCPTCKDFNVARGTMHILDHHREVIRNEKHA